MATAAKRGRPTLFTPELAERICDAIATNAKGLDWICEHEPSLPHPATISRWQAKDADFCEQVTRAGARRADILFNQCLDIADDSAADAQKKTKADRQDVHATEQVARSKLRVETRLKMAAMLNRKKYGDKVTVAGDAENPLAVETVTTNRDRAKALAALVAKQARG